jgi:hypothetical protein
MLYALAYAAVRALLGLLIRRGWLSAADIEVLVLRHEARVARRAGGPSARGQADRLVLTALSRGLAGRDWRVFPVHPATLRRWHRELLHRSGCASGKRGGPGRPPLAPDLRALIERLARENARWGYRRIRDELLKLGHEVSVTAIRTTLRRRGVPPAPRRAALSWPVFLRAQAAGVLAEAAPVADALRGRALALSWLVRASAGRIATTGRLATLRHGRSVTTAPGAPPPSVRLSHAWFGRDRPGATPQTGSRGVPPARGQPTRSCGRASLALRHFFGGADIEIGGSARFSRFRGAHEDDDKPTPSRSISVRSSLGRRRAPSRENGETRG